MKILPPEKGACISHQPMDNLALLLGQVAFTFDVVQQLNLSTLPGLFSSTTESPTTRLRSSARPNTLNLL